MTEDTTNKVLTIAECGHNANGSMKHMKRQIDAAKKCGVDAVKFQCYDIDTIMTADDPVYMELKMCQLDKKEVKELAKYCKKVGIEFMASAFDPKRVSWLEEVAVLRHKIASRSIYDKETIRAMENTGKPIIASLGMLKEGDTIPEIKNAEFLWCISEYPATITEEIFPKVFRNGGFSGFSDHSIGIEWAKEAVRRGATIIEKHFTLDKRLPGCDQAGSADPGEMRELVEFIRGYNSRI